MMACFFLCNDPTYKRRHVLVFLALLHNRIEIMVRLRKETSSNLSVRRQPNSAALAAEGLRHGGNDANFPKAVVERIAHSGLSRRIRRQLYQRAKLLKTGN